MTRLAFFAGLAASLLLAAAVWSVGGWGFGLLAVYFAPLGVMPAAAWLAGRTPIGETFAEWVVWPLWILWLALAWLDVAPAWACWALLMVPGLLVAVWWLA